MIDQEKSMTQAQKNKRLERALNLAVKTLALYGDPHSYRSIGMIADRPCGWFGDDLSPEIYPHYGRQMPGHAARQTLFKLERMFPVKP